MTSTVLITIFMVFCAAYLLGSIPWGLIIARLNGVDIRKVGSGNIGATNVTRTVGKIPGRICFLLDFLKGFVPVLVVIKLIDGGIIQNCWDLPVIAAVFGTVAGHIFPLYLKFKGGKGISTSFGVLLALAPWSFCIAGVLWLAIFHLWRYVSLASIIAAISFPVSALLLVLAGVQATSIPVLLLLVLIAVLAVVKHSSNISRLIAGTESRFERKKTKTE